MKALFHKPSKKLVEVIDGMPFEQTNCPTFFDDKTTLDDIFSPVEKENRWWSNDDFKLIAYNKHPKPVCCPYCNKRMTLTKYKGYYDTFIYWSCQDNCEQSKDSDVEDIHKGAYA